MSEKGWPESKCAFCGAEIKPELETVNKCPNCDAVFWLEFKDDLYSVEQDAKYFFKSNNIEVKIIREFDFLKDEKNDDMKGDEICLICARVKQ